MVLMMANVLMTIWHQLYSSIDNVTQVNSEHGPLDIHLIIFFWGLGDFLLNTQQFSAP